MKWAPISLCQKQARVKRGLYKCAGCGAEVPASVKDENGRRKKNIHVDHINPIVDPAVGWTTWDDCIERMFSELDNLQLLCGDCHEVKTNGEKAVAKGRRGYYKTHPNEYPCYVAMKGRCSNPNKSDYDYYGGRGIKVCKSWEDDFINFYNDLGARPDGTTLDRVDPEGDYEPDNCRWTTHKVQSNNTRRNVYIEYEGVTLTLQEWADFLKVNRSTISYRLNNNWTIEEAFELEPSPTKEQIRTRKEQEKENNGE